MRKHWIIFVSYYQHEDDAYNPKYPVTFDRFITIKEIFSEEHETIMWDIDGIQVHSVLGVSLGEWQYIVSTKEPQLTVYKFNIAAIKSNKQWFNAIPNPTEEMITLQKILWEV